MQLERTDTRRQLRDLCTKLRRPTTRRVAHALRGHRRAKRRDLRLRLVLLGRVERVLEGAARAVELRPAREVAALCAEGFQTRAHGLDSLGSARVLWLIGK